MELKPCPFCGGEAEFEMLSADLYCATCMDCGASIVPASYEYSMEEAAEAWNRRANNG